MSKKIVGNLDSNKLFLNFYHILNSSFKNSAFSDADVKNLKISGVDTLRDLYDLFTDNEVICDLYVCKVNQDSRSSKNNKEFYDVLIRFTSLGILDQYIDENMSLALVGDFELQVGVVNVKRFFLTAMDHQIQHFETRAEGIRIEAATSFRTEQTFTESIFNSHNLKIIKTLNSTFSLEKERWENYLDFQTDINNLKKDCSILYLDYKIDTYIKVPKQYEKLGIYHDNDFNIRNFYYIKKSNNINIKLEQFEEVSVIRLQLLGDPDKYKTIFKDDSLSLFPITLNRNYVKGDFTSLINDFNYNDKLANEIDTNYFLSNSIKVLKHTKNHLIDQMFLDLINNENDNSVNAPFSTVSADIKSIIDSYSFFEVAYEIEADNNYGDIKTIIKEIPKYGYLAINPKGDVTLISRGKWVLDRILKNDVANPYLVNHIFNIENLSLNEIKANERIEYIVKNLNDSQQHCINKALSSSDIFLIQGPPGTGKTQVITEIIHQLTLRDKKVLLSSQNHTAIDNVIDRLVCSPHISTIRLLSDNKYRNSFNAYSPMMVVFNFYNNIYNYVYQNYLSDWEGRINLLDLQKKDYQQLLADIKSWNDSKSLIFVKNEELANIEEKISSLNSQIKNYEHNNTKLLKTLNSLQSLKAFIIDKDKKADFSENEHIDLFIKYFNEIAHNLVGYNIKKEYSLSAVYKDIRSNLDKHLKINEYQELQRVLSTNPKDESIKAKLRELETNIRLDHIYNRFLEAQQSMIVEIDKQISLTQNTLVNNKDTDQLNKNVRLLIQSKDYLNEEINQLNTKYLNHQQMINNKLN